MTPELIAALAVGVGAPLVTGVFAVIQAFIKKKEVPPPSMGLEVPAAPAAPAIDPLVADLIAQRDRWQCKAEKAYERMSELEEQVHDLQIVINRLRKGDE